MTDELRMRTESIYGIREAPLEYVCVAGHAGGSDCPEKTALQNGLVLKPNKPIAPISAS